MRCASPPESVLLRLAERQIAEADVGEHAQRRATGRDAARRTSAASSIVIASTSAMLLAGVA